MRLSHGNLTGALIVGSTEARDGPAMKRDQWPIIMRRKITAMHTSSFGGLL